MADPTKPLNLGLFNIGQALVDPTTGRGSTVFLRWLNGVVSTLQTSYNQLSQIVADVTSALTQAGVAVDTSVSAASAANAASLAVISTTKELALLESYVSPMDFLSAVGVSHILGDDATITIPSHSRLYGDGTIVTVNGGSIDGKNLGTRLFIYYDDPTQAGGSVNYHTTTDPLNAGQSRGRHFVGVITTPATVAAGTTTGVTILPPRVRLA